MSSMDGRLILIIDDEADDRKLIRRLLLSQYERPYTVIEAGTGNEGLMAVDTQPVDCVILDYYLPDMNGSHFIATLKERAGGGIPVPIAMLTGRDSDDVATRALEEGAQDYLVKDGLTRTGLIRSVENAIEKFRIQHELIESRTAIEMRNHKLEVLRDQLQEKIEELAEATQAKDQFMAVMSHEMRTPLNAIIGYADLLELELEGDLSAGQREYVKRILVGSRHLLDLINDVLDLARADARRLELDIRPVDLGAVLEEVSALLQSQAAEKGIDLIVSAPDPLFPPVNADLNRLRQILTNLIGNAIKFTEDGHVRVSSEIADDGRIRVRVEDTGIGIDPEILPLIFSEFYQARGGLSRERGGSGLGLAISRTLAQLMAAEIEVQSALGHGSTFTLTLERSEPGADLRQEDLDAHAARMEFQATPRTPAERVVVVAFGDDPDSLRELEKQVRSSVRLLWTADAAEVGRVAAEERAALVVLDISSAHGAAWRVAHSLQDIPALADTAILLLPSIPAAAPAESGQGIDLGWLSLVPKPFTAAQLTQAVSTAASGRGDEGDPGRDLHDFDVLVVDDDPDSRRVAAKFLAEAGVTVREAPDGESALAEMQRAIPDVVVLDLMMPVLDGFGVLAAMRADPVLCPVPVVVLTAKTLTDAERRFLARTAVRVLQKGEHRLADVAALVLRAAARARRSGGPDSVEEDV
jgi:signal transduction histidine kinase